MHRRWNASPVQLELAAASWPEVYHLPSSERHALPPCGWSNQPDRTGLPPSPSGRFATISRPRPSPCWKPVGTNPPEGVCTRASGEVQLPWTQMGPPVADASDTNMPNASDPIRNFAEALNSTLLLRDARNPTVGAAESKPGDRPQRFPSRCHPPFPQETGQQYDRFPIPRFQTA